MDTVGRPASDGEGTLPTCRPTTIPNLGVLVFFFFFFFFFLVFKQYYRIYISTLQPEMEFNKQASLRLFDAIGNRTSDLKSTLTWPSIVHVGLCRI